MRNILIVHQSSEMYGSDKTLLFLVEGLVQFGCKISVALPNKGPLSDRLEELSNVNVFLLPVLKVHRKMFTLFNMLAFPFLAVYSVFFLAFNLYRNNIKTDIVYSNTLAVLLGGVYAFFFRKKHLWHVHEIIEKPKVIANLFPILVNLLSTKVICNSKATKENLCKRKMSLLSKSVVVLNGLDRECVEISDKDKFTYRESLGVSEEEVLLGLVGRINDWKGHLLLLKAFKKVVDNKNNCKLLFVGSPPEGKEELLEGVRSKMLELNLEDKVIIEPFQSNIYKVWDSIDVAVVPSTKPEPFGLVAVEAMLAKLPVVASKHGGLEEIVQHRKTGLFFEPNNEVDLTEKLEELILNKRLRKDFGEEGYNVASTNFSLNSYVRAIEKEIVSVY